ncbi:phosphotransferase [Nocardia transvalensis]|uniref:phosphotransferase n=1 Tax=Nocardia transvalensis TaxID=37333 RepID=UPI00189440AF|nr:phosphotransferase [Nocardia transvalensis]MBF6330445.1 phosphotransferase [Nocardia transvalensis]
MLTPPADLPDDTVAAALRHWGIEPVSLEYRPVGFGSHHWAVADRRGERRFVTVDELDLRRKSLDDSHTAAFERLCAALTTARALREAGLDFVVAPIRGRDGTVLARIGDRFALACYPHLEGTSYDFGTYRDEDHRRAVFDMIVAVHTTPGCEHAQADDFVIAHRDELTLALADNQVPDAGPYAAPMRDLLHEKATAIRAELARYDELAELARAEPERAVLTHGEPHPANTMRIAEGWRLIDWDTALIAPPERDLWDLDPDDGSLLTAYAQATGTTLRPELLELYRRRWDLADVAEYVHRFRHPHTGSEDDVESWKGLRQIVSDLADRT